MPTLPRFRSICGIITLAVGCCPTLLVGLVQIRTGGITLFAHFAGSTWITEHNQREFPETVRRLKRVAIGLTGTNTKRVIKRCYEDLSVADLSGARAD